MGEPQSTQGADKVWIPIDDGGSMEVPAKDPRAIAYLREWAANRPPPKPPADKRGTLPKAMPRQGSSGIYTVQPGDTLSAVAKDLLGDANKWRDLARLNDMKDPNFLLVGQHLVLPNQTKPTNASTGSASIPPGSPGTEDRSPVGPIAPTSGGSNASGSSSGGGGTSGHAQTRAPARALYKLARGFTFIVFEQLPEVGAGSRIIRKVAIVPKNYAFPPWINRPVLIPRSVGPLMPANRRGLISPGEHVRNVNPEASPFLSASERPFGSAGHDGTPLLIDVAKVRAAGGKIITLEELIRELDSFAIANPGSFQQMQKLIRTIRNIEGEVLVSGRVPGGASKVITGPAHLGHIKSAERLWAAFKEGKITSSELEAGLVEIERAYGRAKVIGRIGRVLTVVGLILTALDLTLAGEESFKQHSAKPISAEVVRQIGGWGGAVAGAKLLGMFGAAFGLESGPGAIITGAIGAIAGGYLGYIGSDLIADQIYAN